MPSNTIDIRLRRVMYWVNWLSAGFAAGKWESIFLGRGYRFQGVAPFKDDPDIARLNLPASVITGELMVSRFSKRRNVNLYLLGSLAPSMAFGSQITKIDRLALLAAVIAFSASRLKDSFTFFGYTDRVETNFPFTRDSVYPLLLAKSIMDFDWRNHQMGGLWPAALQVGPRRSLVILASDFLGDLGQVESVLKLLAPRHQVLPLVIWDEREVVLPGTGFGFYPLRDLTTGELTYVFLTNAKRQRFADNSRRRKAALEELFRRYGLQPHFLVSGQQEDDIAALMTIFFRLRSQL